LGKGLCNFIFLPDIDVNKAVLDKAGMLYECRDNNHILAMSCL